MSGPAGQHFVMGWAKTIHFYGAIVFALSVTTRVLWMFMGNRYATWDKFIPVAKRRRRGLWDSLRYYMFQLRQPPGFVGHNPLAGFTYTFVFLLFFVMITTGLGPLQRERPGRLAVPDLPLPAAAVGRRADGALRPPRLACG